jgi:hypothetical protein
MTHSTDARRNGTCMVPNCRAPRHVSKSGRVYTKCDSHYREDYQHAATRPPGRHRPERHPSAVGNRVQALIVDYATERIWRVDAVVCTDEPMPESEGELMKLLAETAEMGIYVAKPQPFKIEDLYNEEVEEIRT